MIWVGLDLHKRYITACATDEDGQVIAEHRRLPADAPALLDWLTALGGPVTVAMEATLYWAWLHDQLSAGGIAAVAAHPYQVKLIWQARCKTDPIDAHKLADLLRAHLLPAVWVPDPEVRARRKLLRGRAYLVRLRTSVKNRIHGHLTAENCRTSVTDLYGRAGRAWLATVALSPMGRLQVDLLLEVVDALTERIHRLDDRVKRLAQDDPAARRLQTWPGIGLFGAALLVAEIGTLARFRSSHELAAYAGLTPSTQSSGDKTRHGSVGRAGSPWLKWILIEIVQSLKLAPGPVGQQYQRLLRSKGKAKATVAAARKLCCYPYWGLGRVELRGVAPATRQAGGAPGATAGFGGVGCCLPGNPNGPPPSHRCSWTVASAEAREASFVLRLRVRERLAYSWGARLGRDAAPGHVRSLTPALSEVCCWRARTF